MPPKVGNDGRLYYNYNVGLRVVMKENNEGWHFEIKNATYLSCTEYYTCARNGELMPAQLSANRVRFLLSVCGQEVIAAGEARELPLLPEEVENFYSDKIEYYDKQLAKMVNCKAYGEARTKINALACKIGTYEALEKPGVEELKKEYAEIENSANEILIKAGVDVSIFNMQRCPDCNEHGFDKYGSICACAYAKAEEIKDFNAKIRLKARKYQN